MGIVYKLVSPSGKGYVGQTIQPLKNRLDRHRDMRWGNCKLIKRAIAKYGWKQMTVSVLWTGSNEQLNAKEIELIAAHGTLAPAGYNALPGGDINPMHTDYGREAVRASWKDDEVKERHKQGRLKAWQDPGKRANYMAGMAKRRQRVLDALPPEQREAKEAQMILHARRVAESRERRTASSRLQSNEGSSREHSESNASLNALTLDTVQDVATHSRPSASNEGKQVSALWENYEESEDDGLYATDEDSDGGLPASARRSPKSAHRATMDE
jgi:group I intron endonuclease